MVRELPSLGGEVGVFPPRARTQEARSMGERLWTLELGKLELQPRHFPVVQSVICSPSFKFS